MINLSAMALRLLCFLALAAFGGGAALAADPTPAPSPDPCADSGRTGMLATIDRPTVGFSACAVKRNDVLAEFGYANQTDAGGATPAYPQGLIRYGAAPNLELDVLGPSGHFDSGAGLKYELRHDASGSEAIDFLYTAPNGAPGYSAGYAVETVNFDAGTSLGGTWSGGITLGYQMGAVSALLPSAVVVKQFTPSSQAYVEAFGATRTRPGGGWRIGYDAGLQYLLNDRLEVDAEAGTTASDQTHAHYLGFGFGVRF